MLKSVKYLLGATFVSLLISCSEKPAVIDAVIEDAASSDVILKRLDLNSLVVIDTVSLDEAGKFTYSMQVREGDPDIVYVFRNDKKIASLIVQSGDKIGLSADTLGNYSVTGSEESEKFVLVEKDYADAFFRMNAISSQMNDDAKNLATLQEELGQVYVDYYRSRVRYIMENQSSLTTIPVIYQTLGENLPVFGQMTDAIHIKNVSESLMKTYPESRYVRALAAEAKRRMEYMQVQTKISMAEEIGFPEISLTDMNGEVQTLSKVDKKAVLLYFWTSTDASQKMFNLEYLLPIYKDYASKGLEIYQVALDMDKSMWLQVAKAQKLPWISVCDIRGTQSPYVAAYNLQKLPTAYLIYEGSIVDEKFTDGPSLRKVLKRLL